MTHDVVDRRATAVREPAVSQSRGEGAAAKHVRAHNIIKFAGGDTGHDMRDQVIEHFGRKLPRRAHSVESFGAVELDGAIARGTAVGRCSYVSGHESHIDQLDAKKTVCPKLSFCVCMGKGKGKALISSARTEIV